MSVAGRFLERWSRLKRQGEAEPAPVAPSPAPAVSAADAVASPEGSDAVLPPVESLDLASDFSAFLKKEVSESLRRAALRKLFNDPHFNRMDGLDIYIDDYSVSDPIPPEMMQRLRQFDSFLRDERDSEAGADAVAGTVGVSEDAAPAKSEDSAPLPETPTQVEAPPDSAP
ncbi:DUF3306 domain-containing protein [Azoarcus sp. KH32C]|uniref:DUF3306 domain-containing protein n=1 Tax=Azoarcus sp. KH32C TaxID=748247 RepID=UPI00023860BF|nr:DUF3306 domain-containing protein [Azoarcus sp. KH32C]BAL22418.1 hypothetical protein AZKH_0071 [Azoarcus sp. KH32C]